MDAGDVCYQVARKGTNHFSAGFEGVMMIQGKSHSLDSGRQFSQPSYPCVEMLIRGQPGHCSPQNWGLAVYAHQPWPLSKRSFGHLELKSKHWGFEKCFGLSQLMDIAHEKGQFLDPNGSSGATTTRGWVTLEGQAPLSRARQTTVGVHTD